MSFSIQQTILQFVVAAYGIQKTEPLVNGGDSSRPRSSTLTPSCLAAMSKWLNDGEVLVGQGSGEAVPVSPRLRSLPPGSPMPSRVRSPQASPGAREGVSGSPQAETMGKARELFVLCDKEGKGFITKRDMQVRQKKKSCAV